MPKKPSAEKLKIRFTVAPDVQPGVRDFRIATPQGVSTLGQVVIVRDPIVQEKGNNDTLDKAQPISLPATVCGAIEKPEDGWPSCTIPSHAKPHGFPCPCILLFCASGLCL